MFDDSDNQLKSECRDIAITAADHALVEYWITEFNAAVEEYQDAAANEARNRLKEFKDRRLARH
jgi:hypothetical protein